MPTSVRFVLRPLNLPVLILLILPVRRQVSYGRRIAHISHTVIFYRPGTHFDTQSCPILYPRSTLDQKLSDRSSSEAYSPNVISTTVYFNLCSVGAGQLSVIRCRSEYRIFPSPSYTYYAPACKLFALQNCV